MYRIFSEYTGWGIRLMDVQVGAWRVCGEQKIVIFAHDTMVMLKEL